MLQEPSGEFVGEFVDVGWTSEAFLFFEEYQSNATASCVGNFGTLGRGGGIGAGWLEKRVVERHFFFSMNNKTVYHQAPKVQNPQIPMEEVLLLR